MDLYVIRHAEAVPLGEWGITEDADRPLTDQGKEQVKKLAEALQRKGVRLGTVLTSPLLRARQTADVLIAQWGQPAPELHECAPLAPGGKRRRLARALQDLSTDAVALVGHEPDLGRLVGWLTGGRRARIEMGKGGVACLRCDDVPGKGCAT